MGNVPGHKTKSYVDFLLSFPWWWYLYLYHLFLFWSRGDVTKYKTHLLAFVDVSFVNTALQSRTVISHFVFPSMVSVACLKIIVSARRYSLVSPRSLFCCTYIFMWFNPCQINILPLFLLHIFILLNKDFFLKLPLYWVHFYAQCLNYW